MRPTRGADPPRQRRHGNCREAKRRWTSAPTPGHPAASARTVCTIDTSLGRESTPNRAQHGDRGGVGSATQLPGRCRGCWTGGS